MSIPSGKPFDQSSLPEFPSRRLNEEPKAGNPPIGEYGDGSPSEYAPKRLRVVSSAAAETGPVDLGAAPRFLTRDNKTRDQQQRIEPRLVVEPVDGPMRLHANAGDAGAQHHRPVELDGLNQPVEPNPRHSTAPEPMSDGGRSDPTRGQLTGAERPITTPSGATSQESADLDRLEASLRWLKNQDVDLRSESSRKSLLTADPRPGGLHGQRHSSALVEAGIREPKTLEPESLLAPALRRAHRDSNRGTRWVLIACLVAAPLAVLTVTMLIPASEPNRDVKLASAELRPAVRMSAPTVQLPTLTFENETDDLAMPSAPPVVTVTRALARIPTPVPAEANEPSTRAPATVAPPIAPPAETSVVPPPQPVIAPRPAPPPALALRQMDIAEVQILVQQGEHFMAVGDVVAARMVFQRAAETGDGGAAMALGATYDPLVLARLGTMGMVADVTKARHWYQKAKEFGSQEAPRRLELLANR